MEKSNLEINANHIQDVKGIVSRYVRIEAFMEIIIQRGLLVREKGVSCAC